MNCPKCNSKSPVVLAEDTLKCECGKGLFMQYWFCGDCNYSFRTNNNRHVDGWDMSQITVETTAQDLAAAIREANETEESDSGIGSLLDLMQPCVRCGELTTYESSKGVYKCSSCDFEWEILENG